MLNYWVKICTKQRKFLVGIYSPPASMLSKETSIGLVFDIAINVVTVVGDFNLVEKLKLCVSCFSV